MAYDPEQLAKLTDKELASLDSNVRRLAVEGTAAQRLEAERLGPLIEHERTIRKPAPTAAVAKKAPAKRAKAKKKEGV